MHLTVRNAEALFLWNGPLDETELLRVPCVAARFSKDGSKLGVITDNALLVYDTSNCKELQTFRIPGLAAFRFSPCATYVQTFQKPSSPQEKNVGIWELRTGAPALMLYQKQMTSVNWPALQFSDDETVACRLSTNSVHIYDGRDLSKGVVDQLRLPSVQAMQLSTAPPSYIATYVPESKGQPSVVHIYERTSLGSDPVCQRRFFKSSSVDMVWNHGSTAVLVLAYNEQSYKTYYGEFRLHYLRSDGRFEGAVPLSSEGPVHDAQWSPTGNEFIVVYGYMPAKMTLFDTMCKPIFEFGSGSFNTVKWNPFGTFVCFGGFGNLPGDMAFWDRSSLKQMGSTKAACSVTCEWSPDGRFVLTATTAPRMNVDNGVKVFKYTGELLKEKKITKLYQAEWQPGEYVDRPASPKAVKSQLAKTAAAKPAAYRPPQASNMAAVRAQLFGEDESSQKSGGEMSKAALRNKKRREKQKEKSEAKADVVAETEEKMAAVNLSDAPEAAASSDTTSDTTAKKLRALKKKLRQIEEMRTRLSGQAPSQSQQVKLDQEAGLIAQIQELEAQ